MALHYKWRCAVLLLCVSLITSVKAADDGKNKEPKKKKDIRDYNDADMARVLEEWETKDDDIEESDLPEHRRTPPLVDFSKINPYKPEEILKMTKKSKPLLVFASVSGNPAAKEMEEITGRWQSSLFNANYDVQRFVVGSDRVIFMLRDGSFAWKIKDFLVGQDRCADVTVEGQVHPGKAAKKPGEADDKERNEINPKKRRKKLKKEKPSTESNRANKAWEDL